MFSGGFQPPPTANKTVEATAGKFLVEVGVLRAVPHLCVRWNNLIQHSADSADLLRCQLPATEAHFRRWHISPSSDQFFDLGSPISSATAFAFSISRAAALAAGNVIREQVMRGNLYNVFWWIRAHAFGASILTFSA